MEEICWTGLKGCSYIRIKIPERIAVHCVLVPLGEDAYRLAVPRDYSQHPWLSGAGRDAA
jgi:hypothetical protein